MKTTNINTFLRPALLEDIFSNAGTGQILEGKQFFFKENDGSIYGPHRLSKPFSENNTMLYKELFQLLNDERILFVDHIECLESIKIELPLKSVEEDDILQNKILIINTSFFLKRGPEITGAFFINEKTTKETIKAKAINKLMLVYCQPAIIEVLDTEGFD
jgi:hypothetical protein